MPKTIPLDSVGVVVPQIAKIETPLHLECGKTLEHYQLIYETYGQLNDRKSNAILICHALSGDHHAAGYHQETDKKPGWWDSAIGPGKPIDTNRFFVVSLNNLGGCNGSTGPTSINPETGRQYGPDFPFVTCRDWVESQRQLMLYLGLEHWCAVIGGSLGGMQALQWSIQFPTLLNNTLVIASAPGLTDQNTAFSEVARQAIMQDPDFHDGRYEEHGTVPSRGLMLARMLGHITYLSEEAMHAKFGRELQGKEDFSYNYDVEFQVESYLRYQGRAFINRFDANSYLLMTKALDYFNPAAAHGGDLSAALAAVEARTMVISFTSDWRFSPRRSKEIVNALVRANKRVSYAEIEASQGHDSFLLPIPAYLDTMRAYLDRIAEEHSL